jgi:hypothetical protein
MFQDNFKTQSYLHDHQRHRLAIVDGAAVVQLGTNLTPK